MNDDHIPPWMISAADQIVAAAVGTVALHCVRYQMDESPITFASEVAAQIGFTIDEMDEGVAAAASKLATLYALAVRQLKIYAERDERHANEPVQISERQKAVIESGLSVRQAHEATTGCSPAQICDNCLRHLTDWKADDE